MPNSSSTVVTCYELLDPSVDGGVLDFTEGIYNSDISTCYEVAQKKKRQYLLKEALCKSGSRILDAGCGNGTLLQMAKEMGAEATGISISPSQVRRCTKSVLNVLLLDYRDIPSDWEGQFDAIIASGSIEHFVRIDEAEKASEIYENTSYELMKLKKHLKSMKICLTFFTKFSNQEDVL